jgi:hypothetical protein
VGNFKAVPGNVLFVLTWFHLRGDARIKAVHVSWVIIALRMLLARGVENTGQLLTKSLFPGWMH